MAKPIYNEKVKKWEAFYYWGGQKFFLKHCETEQEAKELVKKRKEEIKGL